MSVTSALSASLAAHGRTALGPCLIDDLLRPENADYLERDLVVGHFGTSLIPAATNTFTVLREPAAHLRSWYEHVARDPSHYFHDVVVSEQITFSDWLTDERFAALTFNPQARHLGLPWELPSGEWDPEDPVKRQREHDQAPLAMSDDDLLEAAMATLRGCAVVGTTDDVAGFATRTARVMGLSAPVAVPRLNESDVRTAPLLTADAQSALDRRTVLDRLLYEHARSRAQRARLRRRWLFRR